MRTHRFALAGVALVASTILISCSSDDNNAPANSGVPSGSISSSTISSLPVNETTVDISSQSSVDDSATTP